jgi:hypothetical protein
MPNLNKDAYLEKPQFGKLPEQEKGPGARANYNFLHLLEACRERPGEDACIAVFKKGGKDKTLQDQRAQVGRLWRYLRTYAPLEDWEVHSRMTPGTWCDREIWVCYWGTLTEEESKKEADLRVQIHSNRIYSGLDRKNEKEARAKAKDILRDVQSRRRQAALR